MSKNRSARLDIRDMPLDKTRALGGLRHAICASFNYCRRYPAKMAVLKEVLKYAYNRVVDWEKQHAETQDTIQRNGILAEAAMYGLDLDERSTTSKLRDELEVGKAEFKAKQAEKGSAASTEAKDPPRKPKEPLPPESTEEGEAGQDAPDTQATQAVKTPVKPKVVRKTTKAKTESTQKDTKNA